MVREALRRISVSIEQPFASCDPSDANCVNRSANFSREVLQRVFDAMVDASEKHRRAAEKTTVSDSTTLTARAAENTAHPGVIDEAQFASLCKALKLGLSDVEVARVWRQVDVNQDGTICFEEFERAIQRRRLLRRIVSAYLTHDALLAHQKEEEARLARDTTSYDDDERQDTRQQEEEEEHSDKDQSSLLSSSSSLAMIKKRDSSASRTHKKTRLQNRTSSLIFEVPSDYDYGRPTCVNYADPEQPTSDDERRRREQASPFAKQRALVDFSYHPLYDERRRKWQDAIIASIAVRIESQTEPWVVYTCGAMGSGKGYALHWLSEQGYFPLENIVHLDPDRFKEMMPEWRGYVAQHPDAAGSRCHKESGFLAEIAQTVAMERRQHVWVDGSLRDAEYYVDVFRALRRKYPAYRVAIFYVYASRDVAWRRVKARAEATGRDVPEALFDMSVAAPAESLRVLTPYVDFLARLRNEEDGETPVLEAFESVDHSGAFDVIRRRFGESEPHVEFAHFPERRGARRLVIVPLVSGGAAKNGEEDAEDASRSSRCVSSPKVVAASHTDDGHRLMSVAVRSPRDDDDDNAADEDGDDRRLLVEVFAPRALTFDRATRRRAAVPDDAVFFAHCTLCTTPEEEEEEDGAPRRRGQKRKEDAAVTALRSGGGLAYLDLQQRLLRVVAFCDRCASDDATAQQPYLLRFLPPVALPLAALKVLRPRWRLLPRAHKARAAGATAHCWLEPFETLLGHRYSACGGEVFLLGADPPDADDLVFGTGSGTGTGTETGTEPGTGTGTDDADAAAAPPTLLFFPIRGAD